MCLSRSDTAEVFNFNNMKVIEHNTVFNIGDMVYFMQDNKIERGIVFAIQYVKTEIPFKEFNNLIEEAYILQKVVERTINKTIKDTCTSTDVYIYKVAIFERDSYSIRHNNPVITVDSSVLFRTKELLLATL